MSFTAPADQPTGPLLPGVSFVGSSRPRSSQAFACLASRALPVMVFENAFAAVPVVEADVQVAQAPS